jgi:hypothetical protein
LDQSYQPFPQIFSSKGLAAFMARDRTPEGFFWNLNGFEVRQENALSSRLGRVAITSFGGNNYPITFPNPPGVDPIIINTLGRLRSPGFNTYRYAAGYDPLQPPASSTAQIYRRASDAGGPYTKLGLPPLVAGPPFFTYSGNIMSMVTYRPSFSGTPYIYFADQNAMVKDNGTSANVSWWGFLPPWGYVTATYGANTVLTLTSVSNAGTQAVYNGTITGGAGNAFAGLSFAIAGFTNAGNNGTFTVASSTGSTLTLNNPNSVAETHAGTATLTGPNVSGNGNNYDYRLTLYNQNTGDESNPTAVMVASNTVAPINQQVTITWVMGSPSATFAYQDTQATHFRIYRRGGTLFSAWLLIGTVPISATQFIDTFTDAQIANNPVLAIDNDPPCTVALTSQYNTTVFSMAGVGDGTQTMTVIDPIPTSFFRRQVVIVDTGANQEIVLIKQVFSTTQFSAFFQLTHAPGVPVVISTKPEQGMNLAAMAFEQAFVAGDPLNPNRLYYSKPQTPSAFPPQNYIEIGVPSDPIMAVIGVRGQLFAFTQSRIYRILSVGSGTPDPIPTGSRHGLAANFAWAIAEDGIYYLSFDGVYIFTSDDSMYVSEPIEWLLADKQPNLGPVQQLNQSFRPNSIAAYCKGEFFLCYYGQDFLKHRLIYDTIHKRWRNDDVSCDAMFFEEDTAELVISEMGDGMVYTDRRSDWDQEGFVGGILQSNPIPLNLLTPSYDQGAPRNDKIYNEFMIDADTGGTTLTITLLFDNGATPLVLGTINNVGRQQTNFRINNGDGQISKNVAVQVTGSVSPTAQPTHLYEWHIKAAVDAESRKSYDSYWSKMGTDEFKFVKQAYFEYSTSGNDAIVFYVYLEGVTGQKSVPPAAYLFSLPPSTSRASVKVRFPANKAKLWRFTAVSASDFKLFGESFIEYKPVCNDKGYGKMTLGQISAQGGV